MGKDYATTTGGALEFLADFLDASDQVIVDHARLCLGKTEFELGDEVQEDLRNLAGWLREHPEIDAQLLQVIPNFRRWTGQR